MNKNNKWKEFISILFSPSSVIFLLLTITAFILSYLYNDKIYFSTLITIIGGIFGSIFGSLLIEGYKKLFSNNLLEKKGRSAFRNLKSIEKQLYNINSWILKFSKSTKKKENKNVLAEINRHISTIHLNIHSGLEDWIDIIPELKESSEQNKELEKNYKEYIQSVRKVLIENRKELISPKNKENERELKKKITSLEKQIDDIKIERSQVFNSIGSLTGLAYSSESLSEINNSPESYSIKNICLNCKKPIDSNPNPNSSGVVSTFYCQECSPKITDFHI